MYRILNRATGEVFGESGLFAHISAVRLLFPVRKIIRVFNTFSGMEYEAGRDWIFEPETQNLVRPETSRIPLLSEAELHPAGPFFPAPEAMAVPGGLDGRPLRFCHRSFFAEKQFSVDYIGDISDFSLQNIMCPLPGRLPRLRSRLAAGGRLNINWFGDSISEGYNSSGYHKFTPFQPPFAELTVRNLGERFGISVDLHNHSRDGAATTYPLTCRDRWQAERPDLTVIAFGMNDFAMPYGVDGYLENIKELVSIISKNSPETEFLLVSSMSGNPQWINTPPEKAAEFAGALRNFAEYSKENIAFADLFALWQWAVKRKSFMDLTGNGVNHPNDFGHSLLSCGVTFVLGNR